MVLKGLWSRAAVRQPRWPRRVIFRLFFRGLVQSRPYSSGQCAALPRWSPLKQRLMPAI
jgi:hypothetical protein